METLEPLFHALPYRMCDHCFATLYIWQYKFNTRIAIEDGVVYLVYGYETARPLYFMPLCADALLPAAIARVREDAAARGVPLTMGIVNDALRQKLDALFPDAFDYTEDRDSADYIYKAEALRTYAGRKLHSKRNFINRFAAEFAGRYVLEDIGDGNLAGILDFNRDRCLASRAEKGLPPDAETCGMHEEACAISTALLYRDALRIKGVCLKLDGKVIAYALGTRLSGDTYLEQIEKADPTIPGAYPMITRAFAERCAAGAVYLNREEDMGIEGLRRAKLSFHPEAINMRYLVTPKEG